MVEILWRVWQAEMPDADLPVVSCVTGRVGLSVYWLFIEDVPEALFPQADY